MYEVIAILIKKIMEQVQKTLRCDTMLQEWQDMLQEWRDGPGMWVDVWGCERRSEKIVNYWFKEMPPHPKFWPFQRNILYLSFWKTNAVGELGFAAYCYVSKIRTLQLYYQWTAIIRRIPPSSHFFSVYSYSYSIFSPLGIKIQHVINGSETPLCPYDPVCPSVDQLVGRSVMIS